MKIFEFITYPHISLSQVENLKKPLEVVLNEASLSKKRNRKLLSELEAREKEFNQRLIKEIIKDIGKHTKTSRKIINKLLAFFNRYDVVNPSQQFMGNMVGAERETVNRLLKVLHNLGYIKKQDNGWAVCDKKKKGEFIKNKLTYFMGSRIKLLLKLINTRTRYYTKEIAMAVALIPALGLFIGQNITDTNSMYKYKEITSITKRSNYEVIPQKGSKTSLFLNNDDNGMKTPTSIVPVLCPYDIVDEGYSNPAYIAWIKELSWKRKEEKKMSLRKEKNKKEQQRVRETITDAYKRNLDSFQEKVKLFK